MAKTGREIARPFRKPRRPRRDLRVNSVWPRVEVERLEDGGVLVQEANLAAARFRPLLGITERILLRRLAHPIRPDAIALPALPPAAKRPYLDDPAHARNYYAGPTTRRNEFAGRRVVTSNATAELFCRSYSQTECK